MPPTSTQIDLNTDYQNAERFPYWMALSVFSAVCLAAVNSQQNASNRTSADKWVLSVTVLSMCFSFFSVVAYLTVRHLFVATIPEISVTIFLFAIWAAGLPVLMNPNNRIAVSGDTVENANLYFFSWMSFAVLIFISASLLQEYAGINVKESALSQGQIAKWCIFASSSIIVMVSSVRIFHSYDCGGLEAGTEYCNRTSLGISMGVISTVGGVALAYMLSRKTVPAFMELCISSVLLALWCFGVGFVTFGIAPGAKIGNLYFSSWISFILIVVIFSGVFRDFLSARSAAASNSGENGVEELERPPGSPSVPDEEDI